MSSTRNPGRMTGLLYLFVSMPGAFALMYVPGKLIVHDNPTATLGNIAASETLFRLGIAAELVGQGMFIFVALALYDLLRSVNERRARAMVILIVTAIPIAFLNELNALATLRLIHGDGLLAAIAPPQRQALAMLFFRLHGDGLDIAAIFWGLWLFPLGLLVYRSGFLPRILGVLLIANCASYVVNSLASLALPRYEDAIARWMTPLGFGELLFMAWLLVAGAKPTPMPGRAAPA